MLCHFLFHFFTIRWLSDKKTKTKTTIRGEHCAEFSLRWPIDQFYKDKQFAAFDCNYQFVSFLSTNSFLSSFLLSVGEDARSYVVKNLMCFAILTYRFYWTIRARVTFKIEKVKLRMLNCLFSLWGHTKLCNFPFLQMIKIVSPFHSGSLPIRLKFCLSRLYFWYCILFWVEFLLQYIIYIIIFILLYFFGK